MNYGYWSDWETVESRCERSRFFVAISRNKKEALAQMSYHKIPVCKLSKARAGDFQTVNT